MCGVYSTRTCKHNCMYACSLGASAVRIELSRARAGCRLSRIYWGARAGKTREARITNWRTHQARLRESDFAERGSIPPPGMDAEENKRKRSQKRLSRHSIHPRPTFGGVARSLSHCAFAPNQRYTGGSVWT